MIPYFGNQFAYLLLLAPKVRQNKAIFFEKRSNSSDCSSVNRKKKVFAKQLMLTMWKNKEVFFWLNQRTVLIWHFKVLFHASKNIRGSYNFGPISMNIF